MVGIIQVLRPILTVLGIYHVLKWGWRIFIW